MEIRSATNVCVSNYIKIMTKDWLDFPKNEDKKTSNIDSPDRSQTGQWVGFAVRAAEAGRRLMNQVVLWEKWVWGDDNVITSELNVSVPKYIKTNNFRRWIWQKMWRKVHVRPSETASTCNEAKAICCTASWPNCRKLFPHPVLALGVRCISGIKVTQVTGIGLFESLVTWPKHRTDLRTTSRILVTEIERRKSLVKGLAQTHKSCVFATKSTFSRQNWHFFFEKLCFNHF